MSDLALFLIVGFIATMAISFAIVHLASAVLFILRGTVQAIVKALTGK